METQAILPTGVQFGSTCGLHAFCHLLRSARRFDPHKFSSSPSRKEFERIGLAGRSAASAELLIQPGGSNYDIAIILANFNAHGLTCFPMDDATRL